MAETTGGSEAQKTTTPKLFVRQSSGLVRNVSVTNALFFNVAAFVGVGLTLYPIFYGLNGSGAPMWKAGPFSGYGWAAIIAGLFCILLAMIFASLTSVMPRSGGDYVFTSRIIHPFLGWLESWTLVIASILIIAFEVPLVLRNLQITALIIHIGAGGFSGANSWFTDATGTITGMPGFIASIVVLLGIGAICLLPTRSFHRVVTTLAGYGVVCFVAMFLFGLIFTHRGSFDHNLPHYTGGVTAQQIAAAGKANGLIDTSNTSFIGRIFETGAFPLILSLLLFQYIGFQYSAYIAGEVRGNVRRGVMVALLGALLIGVLANSVYTDAISSHFGFNTQVGWAGSYWGYTTKPALALPLGQPNSMALLAVIANKGLWPLWALISLGGVVFPFLLCPVYINFISRMQLAWSLDRQVPEWFGRVNERTRAPFNAILAVLALTAVFLFFQSFKDLPTFLSNGGTDPHLPGYHKLNLAGTAWFSITMALLSWCLPGVNAMLVKVRRPDLVRNAPFRRALPWLGLGWIIFPAWIYIFAVIKPIVNGVSGTGGGLHYLENNGIIDAGIFYLIGLVIYFVMRYRSQSAGVDSKMLFTELPPD